MRLVSKSENTQGALGGIPAMVAADGCDLTVTQGKSGSTLPRRAEQASDACWRLRQALAESPPVRTRGFANLHPPRVSLKDTATAVLMVLATNFNVRGCEP